MTIIEAVKSGKRFRRKGDASGLWGCVDEAISVRLYRADILAEDWEIEEPRVEITRAQLQEAFERCWRANACYSLSGIAKELGL